MRLATLVIQKKTPGARSVAYAQAAVGHKAFELYRSCTEPYIRRETAVQLAKTASKPHAAFWSIRAKPWIAPPNKR